MTRLHVLTLVFSLVLVVGCGAGTRALRHDAEHPANSRAAGVSVPGRPTRLAPDEFDRAVIASAMSVPADTIAQPALADSVTTTRAPSTRVKSPAKPKAPPARAQAKPVYVCPMHPEVTDTKPSKCPKCGMTLVLRKAER